MSTALYTTFGNEVKYELKNHILTAYVKNATVKFPLPEATSDILANLASVDNTPIDPQVLSVIETKLVAVGFNAHNATSMAKVLVQVAKVQGVHPTTYFDMNANALNLTVDAYNALNAVRPSGNKVDLKVSTTSLNKKSNVANIIKP